MAKSMQIFMEREDRCTVLNCEGWGGKFYQSAVEVGPGMELGTSATMLQDWIFPWRLSPVT